MAVDVGAGDARYAIRVARTTPDVFVVAVEPSLDTLRRAARELSRRPQPNIALIAAPVEQCAALHGVADEITVTFPWGALLRGVLGRDAAVLAALARLAKPGAFIRVLVSLTERDGLGALPSRTSLAPAYADAGWLGLTVGPATHDDVDAACSTWAKRLGAGRARPAFVLRATRR